MSTIPTRVDFIEPVLNSLISQNLKPDMIYINVPKKYKRFETLSKKAEDKKQYGVAVNAEYRSGQMAGMFVDKKEVKHVGLEGMSREQLEKRLSELEGKIGEAKNIIDVTPEKIDEK